MTQHDRARIVIHPEHNPSAVQALRASADVDVHVAESADDVVRLLDDGAQILGTYTWEDRFLRPSLRWLAGMGVGYEQYPLQAFHDAGVVLTTARGANALAVAEHAFGLLLSCTRGIQHVGRDRADRRWQRPRVWDLYGARMLILGAGHIARAIAERAVAFDMDVAMMTRRPEAYAGSDIPVLGLDNLHEQLPQAQFVVLAMPLSTRTHHVIGAPELALMSGATLINVARGSVVDEVALVAALQSGTLRAAGLDVFEVEPLPAESPLWDMPNVTISPHGAGDSPGFGARWVREFEHNLACLRSGGTWHNRVNLLTGEMDA